MNSVKQVYLCMSTDVIHGGHINIIEKAAALGELTVGILSDQAVASFKRYPVLSCNERARIVQALKSVRHVVVQDTMSYNRVLHERKPDIVVHGDDWLTSSQQPLRKEALAILQSYGGQLIEFPYTYCEEYEHLEDVVRKRSALPDVRRGRLKKLLALKPLITAIEAHNGITGLIAEKTQTIVDGSISQFDAMWVSSLCDSTSKGKPDIELVDISSRLQTIDEIMEVTTKPIIFDGDTGGQTEHFVYNVQSLERQGVSAVIIEDKVGLKKNSLFGIEAEQKQDTIENFCHKISEGRRVLRTQDFMIIARIESLILEQGMEDALTRAQAYIGAGAQGIMIHSRRKEPDEIFAFIEEFRKRDSFTPLVVVPSTFNSVYEDEFSARGVNIVIYANQLTRSGFPAMQRTAQSILEKHRAKEADDICMSIKDILTLI